MLHFSYPRKSSCGRSQAIRLIAHLSAIPSSQKLSRAPILLQLSSLAPADPPPENVPPTRFTDEHGRKAPLPLHLLSPALSPHARRPNPHILHLPLHPIPPLSAPVRLRPLFFLQILPRSRPRWIPRRRRSLGSPIVVVDLQLAGGLSDELRRDGEEI